jgi:hypothetical protein
MDAGTTDIDITDATDLTENGHVNTNQRFILRLLLLNLTVHHHRRELLRLHLYHRSMKNWYHH